MTDLLTSLAVALSQSVGLSLTTKATIVVGTGLLMTGAMRYDVGRALAHELEHVRRRDWLLHVLARVVCAFYWFHPLVWRAGRQLYLSADEACDDAVVERGGGQAFAEQLVAFAGRLSARVPAVVPSMGGGDLSRRVMAIFDPRKTRGRAGVACRLFAAIVAAACTAAVSPRFRSTPSSWRAPMDGLVPGCSERIVTARCRG